MKTCPYIHIRTLLLVLLLGTGSSYAQLLGGLEDKTFNVADSGNSVPFLNNQNQIFFPGPQAGVYVSNYNNYRWGNYPGRHLVTTTFYFTKDGEPFSASNTASVYGMNFPSTSGVVISPSPREFYSVRNNITGPNIFGADSLVITKLTPNSTFYFGHPSAITNADHAFPFTKPLRGFFNTGIAQPTSDRLAFWVTHNPTDTLLPHTRTYVRMLDTSCAPLPISYEIQDFKAVKSAVFQGNIYLLGYQMNDTVAATTRLVILNGSTLQPVTLGLPNIVQFLLGGNIDVFHVLPDGKMLVAGYVFNGSFFTHQAVRLNADGSFDPSFSLSFFSGLAGVKWAIDEAGTIRCASTKKIGASNVIMASLGTLQPNGGITSVDFAIPQECGPSQPLMFHPDYNAFLFQTGSVRPKQRSLVTYYQAFASDTVVGSNHRFYVSYSGQNWPLVNKAGYGMFYEILRVDANPVANKFVAYGDFSQVNKKYMPYVALANADGSLDPNFQSLAFQPYDSVRFYMSRGQHVAHVTNSSKVLISFPGNIFSWVEGRRHYYDTIRRFINGLPDPTYTKPWQHGRLTRTKNGGYVSVRLYENGQPATLPNTSHLTQVRLVRFDAEGNEIGESPSYVSNGSFPDTTDGTTYRMRDIFCEDQAGGIWVLNYYQGASISYFERTHYVRFDPNGTTRIIYPDFTPRAVPLKVEILPGKRMRWTGAFTLRDSTLYGKVVNILETDSTGKMDVNIPPISYFLPNSFADRSKFYALPLCYQSDGKILVQLSHVAADFGRVIYRIQPDGSHDHSFMPIPGVFGYYQPGAQAILGDRLLLGVVNYNWAGYQYVPRYSYFGTTFKNGVLGFRLNAPAANSGYVQGRVTQVVSPASGCNPGVAQRGAGGMIIKTDMMGRIAITDTSGRYALSLDTGVHTITQTIQNNQLQRQVCPVPPVVGHTVHLTTAGTVELGKNFINQTFDCPRLDLKILEPRFRLCSRSYIELQYQNDGVADQPNARIHLNLPEEIRILSATKPYTKLPDSSYVFDLGNLPAGRWGKIRIEDTIGCPTQPDSMARACYSARIEPLSLCSNINPTSIQWDGAWLDAVARYIPALNKVRVVVYNKGNSMADSSAINLTGPGNIYRYGKIKLNGGDSLVTLCEPAITGSIQLQLQQPNACPLGSNSFLFHSGKGTSRSFLNFGSGLLETYTVQACPVFRFSYDPNEKLVQPIGDVEPGTTLDYTIHFENYGNDTAYAVTVEDTLPQGLDVSTLKLGASSHPMSVEIAGTEANPILYFHFRDIKLTGKKQDSVLSKGQLSFQVGLRNEVERGTIIQNRAHIYFDRNEAVTTEFTHTKIAELGVFTASSPTQNGTKRMILAPNPTQGSCRVIFGDRGEIRTVHVSHISGQHVKSITTQAGAEIEIKGLDPGVYVVNCDGYKPQQLIVVK